MNGFLTRAPDGRLTATLRDRLDYEFTLTGTPAERDGRRGYDVEVVMTRVPENARIPWVDE